MNYLRLYSDADGVSHFDPVELEFTENNYAPPAPQLWISAPETAVQVLFDRVPSGWFGDWHPSPVRQFYVQLRGIVEFGVSDGELRQLEPGMVVLLEDVVPPGHTSRAVGDDDALGFLVQLEPSPANESR